MKIKVGEHGYNIESVDEDVNFNIMATSVDDLRKKFIERMSEAFDYVCVKRVVEEEQNETKSTFYTNCAVAVSNEEYVRMKNQVECLKEVIIKLTVEKYMR